MLPRAAQVVLELPMHRLAECLRAPLLPCATSRPGFQLAAGHHCARFTGPDRQPPHSSNMPAAIIHTAATGHAACCCCSRQADRVAARRAARPARQVVRAGAGATDSSCSGGGGTEPTPRAMPALGAAAVAAALSAAGTASAAAAAQAQPAVEAAAADAAAAAGGATYASVAAAVAAGTYVPSPCAAWVGDLGGVRGRRRALPDCQLRVRQSCGESWGCCCRRLPPAACGAGPLEHAGAGAPCEPTLQTTPRVLSRPQLIQRRCPSCRGSGLVTRGPRLVKCPVSGGWPCRAAHAGSPGRQPRPRSCRCRATK